jgi:polyisoprenoid-binding protein YceI
MSTHPAPTQQLRWRIDPAQSSVEFQVRHFYGLMTVKGNFSRYAGTLDLSGQPAAVLTIEADSLDTKHRKRDKHLRSADFFDIENHPQVRFVSETGDLDGERLILRGRLHAGAESIPLAVKATLRRDVDELEVQASAEVDQRQLGMTYSPLGMIRRPSRLIVRGRLVPDDGSRPGAQATSASASNGRSSSA